MVGGQASYATALADYRIVIWPLAEDGQGLVLEGHKGNVIELVYSDDESLLASVDSTGTVILWDLSTGADVQRLQLEVSQAVPAATLAFSPDNQMLAANGKGGGLALWSIVSGEVLAEFNIAKFGILDVDISPDGTKLAAGLSFGGRYDQNARVIVAERGQFDPALLEAGPAVIFDISRVQP